MALRTLDGVLTSGRESEAEGVGLGKWGKLTKLLVSKSRAFATPDYKLHSTADQPVLNNQRALPHTALFTGRWSGRSGRDGCWR